MLRALTDSNRRPLLAGLSKKQGLVDLAYARAPASASERIGIGAQPFVSEVVEELPEIGIGMLGYAFMGKAHSNAFLQVRQLAWPPLLQPRLVAIAGRAADMVARAAARYGYQRSTTDWADLVVDPAIGLFDNGAPNGVHAEPTIAAARAGKHVLCEKPVGRDADESFAIWRDVDSTGVVHL